LVSTRRAASRRRKLRAWDLPGGKRSAQPISFPFHLHDRQLHLAGGPANAHGVTLLLAQERAPERRLVADATMTKVFVQLVASDDLVGDAVAVLVLHGDGRAEEGAGDGRSGLRVDDLERLQHLLQPVDAGVDLAQLPLPELVLVVLAAVAVGGGHGPFLGDAGTLLVAQDAERLAEPIESRVGHGAHAP